MWENKLKCERETKKCLVVATTASFQVAKSSGVITNMTTACYYCTQKFGKNVIPSATYLFTHSLPLSLPPHMFKSPHTWSRPLVTASSPGLWCCSWAARPTNVLVGYLLVFSSAWEDRDIYSPCSLSSCTSLFQRSLFIASMQAGEKKMAIKQAWCAMGE